MRGSTAAVVLVGGDRCSIYRNGDLYIARRGLCIASTHPARSPHPLAPTADPYVGSAPLSALRTFAGGIMDAQGCRGGVVRHVGVVRGAGEFNETRPPSSPPRARLLLRRNVSPIQFPVLKARPRALLPLRRAVSAFFMSANVVLFRVIWISI